MSEDPVEVLGWYQVDMSEVGDEPGDGVDLSLIEERRIVTFPFTCAERFGGGGFSQCNPVELALAGSHGLVTEGRVPRDRASVNKKYCNFSISYIFSNVKYDNK